MVNNLLDIISKIRIAPIQAINTQINQSKPIIKKTIINPVKSNANNQNKYSRKIINKLERTPKQDLFINTQQTSTNRKTINIPNKKQNINKGIGNKKGMEEYFDNSKGKFSFANEKEKNLRKMAAEYEKESQTIRNDRLNNRLEAKKIMRKAALKKINKELEYKAKDEKSFKKYGFSYTLDEYFWTDMLKNPKPFIMID